MYSVERRHLVKLGSTVDPPAMQTVDVPLLLDEVSQYLACWIYMPGKAALGAGTAQIIRNGEALGAATAFAGNTIVLPLNVYQVGADIELELMHPQVCNPKPLSSAFIFDTTLGMFVEDKDFRKYGTPPPVSVAVRVVNTDAVRKDLIVHWVALVWRNA